MAEINRTVYKFYPITVAKVERKTKVVHATKVKDDVKFTTEDIGWFLHLSGNWASWSLGSDEPDLVEGDQVVITIEKINAGG